MLSFKTKSTNKWQVVAGANNGVQLKTYNNKLCTATEVLNELSPDNNNIYKDVIFGMNNYPQRYIKFAGTTKIFNSSSNSSLSIYLFGMNVNNTFSPYGGSSAGYSDGLYGIIYYCKIYDRDALVRDYIPVIDSTERPCLFDKVSRECYYNQGTGEFLYG